MKPVTQTQVRIASAATALALLVLYLITLAPSMTFIDAGELATVAHTFGIAHPTGYPLFTLLAGLWALLPIGDGIFRLNVLSAVLCAATAGVFVHLLWFLAGLAEERRAAPGGRKQQGRQATRPTAGKSRRFDDGIRLVAAVFGALVIGCSETYWSTALSIEVYALHVFFIAWTLWCFARAEFDATLDAPRRMRWWLLFAFSLGLSFANHMTSIMFIPGYALAYFVRNRFTRESRKRAGFGALAFLAGLLPYLYLPIRAATQPALNWGNPATWERFVWHLTGKQYSVWMFAGMKAARKQFAYFTSSFPAEFGYIALALVALGAVYAFARSRRFGTLLLLLFLTCLFWAVNYDIHDIDSYFLLAYAVGGIWAMYGLLGLLRWIGNERIATAAAVAAVVIGVLAGVTYGRVSERGDHLVEDYTKNLFASLKPNALVFSFQWDYWVSAAYYYQIVEGLRPDVIVIDKELLRRSWYFDQLRRNHPALYARSEPEIKTFLAELYKFEHGLPYAVEQIEGAFRSMINGMIDRNIGERPVYLTVELEEEFGAGYARIPEGLAFRLYRKDRLPSPDEPVSDRFTYRPFDRKGRLIDGLNGMYANMLTNRGIYLFERQRADAALKYFNRALSFDPVHADAQRWKARVRSEGRMGDASESGEREGSDY